MKDAPPIPGQLPTGSATGQQPRQSRGYVAAIGFGTAVAIWTVCYVSLMARGLVPDGLLFGLILGCMLAGGYVAGKHTDRGWISGVFTGLAAALVNLLILGSLLSGDRADGLDAESLAWIPGSIVASVVLAVIGAALGTRRRRKLEPVLAQRGREMREPDWTSGFARVAAAATLLLVVAGGLVTSLEAGLAVTDWPNSQGYNMFLLPVDALTGGVFYEHAHRLFGSLVGLAVLALTIQVFRTDRRAWFKAVVALALLLVIGQGVLGGLRVTGTFTLSTDPADTSPSTTLAIIHGISGQLFFGLMAAIAVMATPRFKEGGLPVRTTVSGTDRSLVVIFALMLLAQVVLGALVRHLGIDRAGLIHMHLTWGVLATALGLLIAMRARALYTGLRIYRRKGFGLLHILGLQIVLGAFAWAFVAMRAPAPLPTSEEILFATLHQAAGAWIVGHTAALLLLSRRLLGPSLPPKVNPHQRIGKAGGVATSKQQPLEVDP